MGDTLLKRFWAYNPDPSREEVFRRLLGPGARHRYPFFKYDLKTAVSHISDELKSK